MRMKEASIMKQVFVHSFHSQVKDILRKIDFEPEIIVSFDAHLDLFLGNKEQVEAYPDNILPAALRACSHMLILRTYREIPIFCGLPKDYINIPEMIIVVPQICWETEVKLKYIEYKKMNGDISFKSLREASRFHSRLYKRHFGIDIVKCPPNHPLKILKKKKHIDYDILIDIDVDYFSEMQNECYTPMKKAPRRALGDLIKVKKFLREIQPSIITISEGKIDSLNNPNSVVSNFLKYLKKCGYIIEYSNLYDNDADAEKFLKIYENYQKNVVDPLKEKFEYKIMNEEFMNQLVKRTKQYFKKNGTHGEELEK